MKSTDATKRRRRLLEISEKNNLTNAGVAQLAGEGTSIKTVESWLAKPGAAGSRPIPAYRMELIELRVAIKKSGAAA